MTMMMAAVAALAVTVSSTATQDAKPTLWDADRRLPAVFLASLESDPDEPEASSSLEGSWRAYPNRDRDDEPRQNAGAGFSIGPMGGYMKARGADRGTWFGGLAARLYFLRFLAAEASISFHQNKYNDGDIKVTQYPVQLSGLLFPFPNASLQPYIVGGVGWYYTRIDYSGSLDLISDDTEHWFGGHVGAGAEIAASRALSLFVDFRYIFIDPESDIESRSGDADYWQITFGLGFGF